MTLLDPPAAAARRQNLIDRWVELLVGYGCPYDTAPARAARMLDVALQHGYALPVVLEATPLQGGGSTAEGRARARRIIEQQRAGCPCGSAHLGDHPENHLPGCPVRTAHERGGALPPRSDEHPASGTLTRAERETNTSRTESE